jgi:hypothetical protein
MVLDVWDLLKIGSSAIGIALIFIYKRQIARAFQDVIFEMTGREMAQRPGKLSHVFRKEVDVPDSMAPEVIYDETNGRIIIFNRTLRELLISSVSVESRPAGQIDHMGRAIVKENSSVTMDISFDMKGGADVTVAYMEGTEPRMRRYVVGVKS